MTRQVGARLHGSGESSRAASSFLLLLVVQLACLLWPVSASAAADVRIIESRYEGQFPESLLFHLEAAVVRPTSRVSLNYRIAGDPLLYVDDVPFEAGNPLRVRHEIDLRETYLPPGTRLEYHWTVRDDRGEIFRSQRYQIEVEDQRITWRQLRAPNLELSWSGGDDQHGRLLLRISGQALGQIAQEMGAAPARPIRIFVYSDFEQFQSAILPTGIEWVGGNYYARPNVVVIYAPPTDEGIQIAARALPHELSHAMIHQMTENPFGRVPQWLNEGLASNSEPAMNPSHAAALTRAIAEDRLLSLRSISSTFPVDAEDALLAYAQSESVVTFLSERYGPDSWNSLLRAYRSGVTTDEGLAMALQTDLATLENEWQAWLMPWPLLKATPFLPAEPTTSEEDPQSILDWARGLLETIRGG